MQSIIKPKPKIRNKFPEKRNFTEYNCKDKIQYSKVESGENYSIKQIMKNKEINNSEGKQKISEEIENNNHYENGRYLRNYL